MKHRRALLALAVLALMGCGGRERAAKAEAADVVRIVAALRAAPNEAKKPLLPELKGAACSDPEVCELKRLCISAYERHQRALDLTATVKARLDSGVDAASAAELSTALGQAERELSESRALSEQCTDREGALRRRFKL